MAPGPRRFRASRIRIPFFRRVSCSERCRCRKPPPHRSRSGRMKEHVTPKKWRCTQGGKRPSDTMETWFAMPTTKNEQEAARAPLRWTPGRTKVRPIGDGSTHPGLLNYRTSRRRRAVSGDGEMVGTMRQRCLQWLGRPQRIAIGTAAAIFVVISVPTGVAGGAGRAPTITAVTACKATVKTVETALEAFYAELGSWPNSLSQLTKMVTGQGPWLRTVPSARSYTIVLGQNGAVLVKAPRSARAVTADRTKADGCEHARVAAATTAPKPDNPG